MLPDAIKKAETEQLKATMRRLVANHCVKAQEKALKTGDGGKKKGGRRRGK